MEPNATPAGLKRPFILALMIAAATVALFSPAIRYDFINYDDDVYVYKNPNTLHGLSLQGISYALQSRDGGSWMPLTWLSFMIEGSVWGNHPAGYHLTNILLHAIAAGLLFLAAFRFTKLFWPCVFLAALFAIHPLRVESVVWIAERKDVLCALFWVLGLLAYARYVERPGVGRYGAVFACLAAGLMSKPMAVTFPVVLLLLDHWPLKRFGDDWVQFKARLWPLVREKIPLFLLCTGAAALTVWTQDRSGAVNAIHAPFSMKLLRVADNYAFYTGKLLWPSNLAILYPPDEVVRWRAAISAALILVMMIVSLKWLFRLPWLAVGCFWFFVTLLPVIGLIHVGHITVADRYSYIPSIGFGMVICGLLSFGSGSQISKRALVLLATVIIAAYGILTYKNLPRWQNSLTVFEDSLRKGPHEVAFNNLAVYYKEHGKPELAVNACDKAIQLFPGYGEAFNNRGLAHDAMGDFAAATADFDRAIELQPDSAFNHNNRGATYLHEGDLQRGVADFSAAIKLKPDYALAYSNRGKTLLDLGNVEGAVADCQEATRIDPGLADGWNNLANALSRQGNLNSAITDYAEAIRLQPGNPMYYNNRGAAYFMAGHLAEAKADLDTCRSLGGQPHPQLVRDLDEALNRSAK